MTEPRFDDVIHAPHRLRIAVMAAGVGSVEFQTIREELGLAASVVSKQLKVLADAGYVELTKRSQGGRARTWVALTADGRRALDGHLAELRRMTDAAGPGA